MSFLNLDLDSVPDRSLLPDGEALLKVYKIEEKDSKTTPGNKYLEVQLEAVNTPGADRIFERLMFPNADDDENKRLRKLQAIKAFAQAFDLPLNGFNPEDAVGRQAWANVATESSTGYADKNRVKNWVRSAA